MQEQQFLKNRSVPDPYKPPKREDYDQGSFGDMQYEFAQDRYVMERGKAYAAQHAATGKL